MGWRPNEEEEKYIRLIMSMSTDSLLGNGPDSRETYIQNLRMMADQLAEGLRALFYTALVTSWASLRLMA